MDGTIKRTLNMIVEHLQYSSGKTKTLWFAPWKNLNWLGFQQDLLICSSKEVLTILWKTEEWSQEEVARGLLADLQLAEQGQNKKLIPRFPKFQGGKKILNYLYLPPKHVLIVFNRKTVLLEVQRFLFRVCQERQLQWGSSKHIGGRDRERLDGRQQLTRGWGSGHRHGHPSPQTRKAGLKMLLEKSR